jgi:hypothetical protein
MSSDQNMPIQVGKTGTNLGAYAGHSYVGDDIDYSDTPHIRRTEHQVTRRLVKNSAAIALLPKRLVTFKAGTNRTEVDGYADTTAEDCVPVDEFLPAAGVAVDEYFYVVTHGPATVLTDLAGGANNLLPEGTILVALTGATSGATTSGRVAPQDLTGATAVLGAQLNGAFGRGMSAKTTANTNADLLAFISKRWD